MCTTTLLCETVVDRQSHQCQSVDAETDLSSRLPNPLASKSVVQFLKPKARLAKTALVATLNQWQILPGAGLTTVTLIVPDAATSPPGSWPSVELRSRKVVGHDEPFHCRVDTATNPRPLTPSVKAPLPAVTEMGLTLVMTGAGLTTLTVVVAVMVFKLLPIAMAVNLVA